MDTIIEFIKSLDLRSFNNLSVALRIMTAVLCGGIIGIEREHKHRPAGFRTHILICLGAAITTLTSQYILTIAFMSPNNFISDPSRLGAQVISGIGFIGAGTIIVTKGSKVKGLTTAAGLWTAAIIGLAAGVGYIEIALYTTFLVLISEILFSHLDWKLFSLARTLNLYVEYTSIENIEEIVKKIKASNVNIVDIEITKSSPSEKRCLSAIIVMQMNKKIIHNNLMTAIAEIEGVQSIEEL